MPKNRVPSPERCRTDMMRLGWRRTDDGDWTHPDAPGRIEDATVERRPALAWSEARRRIGEAVRDG